MIEFIKKLFSPRPPNPPELGCVAKTILSDLEKFPCHTWKTDGDSEFLYSHPEISYKLYRTSEGSVLLGDAVAFGALTGDEVSAISRLFRKQEIELDEKKKKEYFVKHFPHCQQC